MRLGIFGGTFDPPHVGHLLVGEDALTALGLDELVFVPAAQQPLKVGRDGAPVLARLEMVRRMVADVPRMSCDAIEVDRSGLSYSVDTLAEYADRHPRAELFFLMGMDAAASLPSWREPRRLAQLAHLVLLGRESEQLDGAAGAGDELQHTVQLVTEITGSNKPPLLVSTRRIDVSSTEIRERVRRGASIRGFVTDEVARFIEAGGLYR